MFMKRMYLSLTLLSLVIFSFIYFYPCFADEWIVEVVSVETGVIESGIWVWRDCFRRSETISFKVTVINRAAVSKDVKITVTVCDRIDRPMGYYDEEVNLPPGTSNIFYLPISIPNWVAGGEAVVRVNALEVIGGMPFPPCCPETSARLVIYYDMRDIALVAKAYGSYPDHPNWDEAGDVNEDGKVDIRDLAIVVKQWE